MRLLMLSAFVMVTSSQVIHPDIIGPLLPSSTQPPEDNTLLPRNFTNRYGESCQCVPYYLCPNKLALDVHKSSLLGWGDDPEISLHEDRIECPESVEICCVTPVDPPEHKSKPDPAKVKGCGYRNPKGVGVHFAGVYTQFGEYPWMIALLDARNLTYVGGAVLIHPEVVMTGAHIAVKFTPGTLKIRAGEWDTQTVKEIYDHQERNVTEIYIHEQYDRKRLKNNIALLRLEQPVELAEHINIICLPEQGEVFDNSKNCIANGWGKDLFGRHDQYSVILKQVEMDVVPHDRCNKLLKKTRLGPRFKLDESFICAGGNEETSQGDGGAPLACPIDNDRYKLSGLVAWSIGWGQKDVPTAFTNVPRFRHWVDDKMADWGLSQVV